jgi:hypothetical protein
MGFLRKFQQIETYFVVIFSTMISFLIRNSRLWAYAQVITFLGSQIIFVFHEIFSTIYYSTIFIGISLMPSFLLLVVKVHYYNIYLDSLYSCFFSLFSIDFCICISLSFCFTIHMYITLFSYNKVREKKMYTSRIRSDRRYLRARALTLVS